MEREAIDILLEVLWSTWHGWSAQGICCVYLKLMLRERREKAVHGDEESYEGVRNGVFLPDKMRVHDRGLLSKDLKMSCTVLKVIKSIGLGADGLRGKQIKHQGPKWKHWRLSH